MRFCRITHDGRTGLATPAGDGVRAVFDPALADLDALVREGPDALHRAAQACVAGEVLAGDAVAFLPPLVCAPKIVCVGLNYVDHAAEAGFKTPDFPTLFGRFSSSLVGHGAPLVKPRQSDQLDFEGEMVAVIGRGGRDIAESAALDHVAAYSVFNDGSVRDYQMKTPQWTAGKNFDGTGAFGPWLVTADELPAGAAGLKIETRINGAVVQSASTADMVFDVKTLVSLLSSFMTLEPGDVIVSGTPAGVGMSRTPPLWLKPGDVCEVEVEGVGLLRNPVAAA